MRIFAFLFLSVGVALASVSRVSLEQVTFEQNVGQTDARVKYMGHAQHETLWLTTDGATLGLSMKSRRAVLKLRFEGANHEPKISAEEPSPGVSNYFIGSDPTRWHASVPRFGKVRYRNLYPGIDVVFYGSPKKLEYDFVLGPGADASKIVLAFDGADRMTIDASDGDLALKIGDLEIRNRKPQIYQGDKIVGGRWVMRGKRRAGFAIDSYDPNRPLVIDPVLTYATYLGGSAGDYGQAVAMDAQGDIYVTGGTDSSDFPTKAGLSTSLKSNSYVAFVSKINPAASGAASLVYSSYVGGTGSDYGQAIAVDSNGNAYLSGFTYSTDFPLKNAFQTKINTAANCRGSSGQAVQCPDGFVLTLSANGSTLVYSSYLGGANYDQASGIAVDSSGNAYVTGETDSTDFPIRGTPYQSRLNGTSDAFLAKIAPNGTLLYSTYFGGELDDFCNGIALDSSGMAYLACITDSGKLPVSANAYQSGLLGNSSAFVAKLNPSISGPGGLIYSSYLGGTGGDTEAFAVAADVSGNIYLTGSTTSPSFPVSAGAFAAFQSQYGGALNDQTFVGVPGDAFIAKLNPAAGGGAQLVYSTYFGGKNDEQGTAIAVDSKGRIIVAGGTDSLDFATTIDAFQPYYYGFPSTRKGFILLVDPSQTGNASLLYATLLGGTDDDMIYGMAADPAANTVVVTGEDFSADAYVTPSAYQPKYGGSDQSGGDAYIARFDLTQLGPLILPDSKGNYVFNSASSAPTGVAPGLIFTVVGQGLGPAVGQQPADFPNGAFPTTLAGVQVLVGGIPAPLLFVRNDQINAIAPYELAKEIGNYVNVQVIYNGVGGNMPNEVVVSTAPAMYAITNQNNSVNTPSNPAAKGSTIIIYATGEGQLNPAGVDGQLVGATLPKPVAQVSVTIDGKPASVSYAGTVPATFDGFLQVNATTPADASSGSVPVVLKIGDQSSPPLNIAVQ
jgi:uncharacterized protein (TIGR03437 family)